MATTQDTELPIDSDSPFYTFGMPLEGVAYWFVIRWNARGRFADGGYWTMALLDENADEENPIMCATPLVLGAQIGSKNTDTRFPDGAFFCSDLSGSDTEATINDLGVRVKVYFRPASAFV